MENSLKALRKKIDSADKQILTALAKRMHIVREIGLLKKANRIPMLDETRWKEVLDSKRTLAKQLGLSPLLVKEIYASIRKEAKSIQSKRASKGGSVQ